MRVKVNLNKLVMLDKEIDLISEQVEGETTSQGLPIYEAKSITGAIYFDKGEFVEETREENLNKNEIVEASAVYNEEMTLSAEEIEGLYGVYYLTILKNGTWESLGYYEEV